VPPAPLKLVSPFLPRTVERSELKKESLAVVGGYPHYIAFFNDVMRGGPVVATALTCSRLERIADAVGFPRDEIFLDGGGR
jgi:hypothetical protein